MTAVPGVAKVLNVFVPRAVLSSCRWLPWFLWRALAGASRRRRVRLRLVMQGAFQLSLRVLGVPRLSQAWLSLNCMFVPQPRAICLWDALSAIVLAGQLGASARADRIACLTARPFHG